MRNYEILPLVGYPSNGEHLECSIDLPVKITKGELFPYDKYGNKTKLGKNWICYLKDGGSIEGVNKSLASIFQITIDKELEVIIKYCIDTYRESLEMELERINRDFI